MAQELIAWFGSKQKPLNATSKSKSRARTKSYPTVLLTNKLKHHQPIKKFQNVKASHALERIMGRRERERESKVDPRCKINGTPARAAVLPPFVVKS
jgi:FPC/CPF motif-containing protein YcgG